ncbi:four-jointed box protein 1-like [Saccoglossus kowalevskii]
MLRSCCGNGFNMRVHFEPTKWLPRKRKSFTFIVGFFICITLVRNSYYDMQEPLLETRIIPEDENHFERQESLHITPEETKYSRENETLPKTGFRRQLQGSFATSRGAIPSYWIRDRRNVEHREFKQLLRLVNNHKHHVTLEKNSTTIIEDGIFWSKEIEQLIPSAEILTFYLSRLLGMDNVQMVVLTHPDPYTEQWKDLKVRTQLLNREWLPTDDVTLSMWTSLSENVSFPRIFLQNERKLHVHNSLLQDMTLMELGDLAQWTDMVLLDFIVLHVDRVTRAMRTTEAAIKDPWLLDVNIKNIGRKGRKFWLFDNEAAFLFVPQINVPKIDRTYHNKLLKSTCVFRRKTVERLLWLHYSRDVESILKEVVLLYEPAIDWRNTLSCRYNNVMTSLLHERIHTVYQHILSCLNAIQPDSISEHLVD